MEYTFKQQDAKICFIKAFDFHMEGELDKAVTLYKKSIALAPSPEAHTYLGWTYSFQGKYDAAINECKKAITLDADFGNPWNDIGAYLIELNQDDEAITFLEQATKAPRYDNYCFPHYNLARIYKRKGMYKQAMTSLKASLEANPNYIVAREELVELESELQ